MKKESLIIVAFLALILVASPSYGEQISTQKGVTCSGTNCEVIQITPDYEGEELTFFQGFLLALSTPFAVDIPDGYTRVESGSTNCVSNGYQQTLDVPTGFGLAWYWKEFDGDECSGLVAHSEEGWLYDYEMVTGTCGHNRCKFIYNLKM